MQAFTLRSWREADAPSLAANANNEKIEANLRDGFPYPYTENDALGYIRDCLNKNEDIQCCRAIEVDGQAVGSIGIFFKDNIYCKSAEIGYWLGEAYWGSHIVSRAICELCAYAFGHYDLARIYAEPFAHNVGSRKALENAHFHLEGILRSHAFKHGRLFDSCIYALFREEMRP